MKNLSKVALAVLASVSLSACLSNSKHDNSAELVSQYSKTEQGQKDVKAIKHNTEVAAKKEATAVTALQKDALVVGSKSDTQQYAQYGIFRNGVTDKDKVGSLRTSVVVTDANKLDATAALAALTAKNEKGDDYKNKLDAHYTGKLAYFSPKAEGDNKLAVDVAALELELKNDQVGGTANDAANHRTFTFEKTSIHNNNGNLAYSGNLTVTTGEKVLDSVTEHGTYTGVFGGDVAPTTEGKYADITKDVLKETAGSIKTTSFEGSFDAKQ
ncbi:hypothetical protein BV154_010470 [Haemophilus influenzae]|uniref:Uncharacterized protein n=1 Tax=Haemophilus influenzae TaxID=727 RepID=A0A2S9RRR5_HAEIF|nr:hypothetical protein [Haemophilus influenzae]PRI43410.1 hypothetical protein BVZ70_00602 [Haemophilus influenzae]PRI88829.1 hypothetical protein BV021_00121 [Haemophilus influenzae]PRI88896.1 hypothetical protein BV020_01799 [Haemophilus influenzae]PRJ64702.1 hypothetical protein BV102_01295 [Haemophilus influenzae]PRJ82839.1 hypothetical protein BV154_00867 [Haemophilus influenzae]